MVQERMFEDRSDRLIAQMARQMVRNRAAVCGAAFLAFAILCAVLAPVLAPYDPLEVHTSNTLEAPSVDHPFGTDDAGRDVLSRVIWGGQLSLRVGLISAGIATSAGLMLGLVSGYYGGTVSFIILRLMDLLLAFPGILLSLVIVSILGRGLDQVMVAVGTAAIPTFTRVVHGSVLSAKTNDYVLSARVAGCSHLRIIVRHLLPNILAPVIVLCTLQVGSAIFAASSLSFIGLGAQPPSPEWGAMVSRGRHVLRDATWMSTFPGLAIATVVVAINIVGDGLREALDPHMRTRW